MQLDNETLVLQLIRQIQLDKLMQPETEKQIGEEDIRTVSGLPEKEMPRKEIGFRAENRMRRSRYMLKDGLVYTESRMGYEQEFLEDLTAFDLKSANGTFRGGPVLFRKNDRCYTDPSDSHDLIVGDTGSQKTLKFVLPLIYSCAMAGESMVIVDPKGELVRKSGRFLERKGYQKVVLDWRKPQESPDRWNPFERVQEAYKRGKKSGGRKPSE